MIVSWFSVAGASSARRAGDHLGQVLERAAAADRELRLERLDLRDDRREHLDDARAQCAAVGLRDRIGVHAARR